MSAALGQISDQGNPYDLLVRRLDDCLLLISHNLQRYSFKLMMSRINLKNRTASFRVSRPGKEKTADILNIVVNRVWVLGCISGCGDAAAWNSAGQFSKFHVLFRRYNPVLIVVSGHMDTIQQVQSNCWHIQYYEGLLNVPNWRR